MTEKRASEVTKAEGDAKHGIFTHEPGFRLRRGRNWFFLGLTYASYYLCRYNLGIVAPELKESVT